MGRLRSRIALWLCVLGVAANAAAQQPSVRFAEPVTLSLKSGAAEFDAYGRRFSLELTGNERVLQKLAKAGQQDLSAYRLLRGSLAGMPGSWVRLTDTPEGVEGAIWDGQELYAVTRHARIAPYLTNPLAASPEQTVVYRLSDARDVLPRDFCASNDAVVAEAQAPTALDQYHALLQELGGTVLGPDITRQIEISLIADTAFQQAEFNDPTAAMLARLNIVEGIFSEQVGLLILATDLRLMSSGADPFTKTKGTELLEQLAAYRESTPAVRARGVAHLMTGKDLDGTTAGIAYVRTVCEAKRGVSLSQRSFGTTISALIMAHELGHNFGAEHDGEAGTVCAGTGGGFIMAPSVTGYSTFSQCSIDTMRPILAAASCVTPAQFADVTVDAGVNSVSGEAGIAFTLPFTVRSAGNVAADGATVSVTLPANAAYSLSSATSTQGACAIDGLTATCAIGSLATNASAQVNVVALSTAPGSFAVQARVGADNDRLSSNNNRQLQVSLRSGIDASLAVQASAGDIAIGAPFEVYADVGSLRALPVRNATLNVNLNQPVSGASMPGGNCNVNASSVICTIAEILPGASRRLTLQATGQTAGSLFAGASVSAPGDGDLTNNSVSLNGWIQAERDVDVSAPVNAADLGVGVGYEIPFTVRSRGVLPTGDITLRLSLPSTMLSATIDAGGAPCTQANAAQWNCELGALAPGGSEVVAVRLQSTGPVTGDISATALTTDDGYAGNNTASVTLRIDHQVDVGVSFASGGLGLEDSPFTGQVTLRSNGRQAATGTVFEIALHAAGLLKAARIHNGADCTLLSATRARCLLPNLPRNAQAFVNYTAEFAEPGDYDVTFTAAAPGDTAPANDTLTRAVLVRPYLDAGLSGSLAMDNLYGGHQREKTFTLTTDRRPLATVRLVAGHGSPALSVVAISAGLGDCRVDEELGGICDFIDLPANSSTAVTVTYRAIDGGDFVADPVVWVITADDVVSANNSLTAHVATAASTDLQLRAAAASVNGARGATLNFPVLEVINGGASAHGARLDVALPANVAVVEVSASNAVCSGTTSLRCDFDTLAPGATASVSFSVLASTSGSLTARATLRAANDSDAGNNSRDVALEIAASSATVTDGGGASRGSGGGGRLEWLMLVFFGALAARSILVRQPRAIRR